MSSSSSSSAKEFTRREANECLASIKHQCKDHFSLSDQTWKNVSPLLDREIRTAVYGGYLQGMKVAEDAIKAMKDGVMDIAKDDLKL
jgi:hypothetical protein